MRSRSITNLLLKGSDLNYLKTLLVNLQKDSKAACISRELIPERLHEFGSCGTKSSSLY
jgi:hypothetical protein